MAELVVRKAVQSDHVFIMDSWMRCLRKSPDSNLPDCLFFPAYRAVAGKLLQTSRVDVLVTPDNQDTILGYIVYDEPGAIHWIYIKRDFRENGLAKLLIARLTGPIVLTMSTPLGRKKLRYPIKAKMLRNKLNRELEKEKFNA